MRQWTGPAASGAQWQQRERSSQRSGEEDECWEERPAGFRSRVYVNSSLRSSASSEDVWAGHWRPTAAEWQQPEPSAEPPLPRLKMREIPPRFRRMRSSPPSPEWRPSALEPRPFLPPSPPAEPARPAVSDSHYRYPPPGFTPAFPPAPPASAAGFGVTVPPPPAPPVGSTCSQSTAAFSVGPPPPLQQAASVHDFHNYPAAPKSRDCDLDERHYCHQPQPQHQPLLLPHTFSLPALAAAAAATRNFTSLSAAQPPPPPPAQPPPSPAVPVALEEAYQRLVAARRQQFAVSQQQQQQCQQQTIAQLSHHRQHRPQQQHHLIDDSSHQRQQQPAHYHDRNHHQQLQLAHYQPECLHLAHYQQQLAQQQAERQRLLAQQYEQEQRLLQYQLERQQQLAVQCHHECRQQIPYQQPPPQRAPEPAERAPLYHRYGAAGPEPLEPVACGWRPVPALCPPGAFVTVATAPPPPVPVRPLSPPCCPSADCAPCPDTDSGVCITELPSDDSSASSRAVTPLGGAPGCSTVTVEPDPAGRPPEPEESRGEPEPEPRCDPWRPLVPPVRFSVGSDDEPTRPSTPEEDAAETSQGHSTDDASDGAAENSAIDPSSAEAASMDFLLGLRVDEDEAAGGPFASAASIVSTDTTTDASSADVNNNNLQRRKKLRTGPAQPKNAVSALNELKPGLEYKVIQQDGPTHAPTFTVQIEVNGEEFVGTGRSKKQAKQTVAEAALRSFIQFKNVPDFQLAINTPAPAAADFTADVGVTGSGDFVFKTPGNGEANGSAEGGEATPRPRLTLTPADKNPVQLLNELRPGLKYDLEEESGEPHAKKFSMSVQVDGEKFDGVGPSKRLGKAAAAKAALSKLYNYSFVNYTSVGGSDSPYGSTSDLSEQLSFPQTVADHISKMVNQQFQSLMENQQSHSRRKVLAGLVMTTGPQMSEVKVISVTTGTKCINGEHMSVEGNSLNDCHAEVISRRCLMDYLYTQLEMLLEPETRSESIFEPRPEGRGYRLKENVQFHLYINTAPCGDARIFSPHEAQTRSDSQDKHPNRKARGQLRTKIESGEGTIPVKSSDGIQTWDGVLQGQRLLTMSCSDKMARWNVVGVQGALLAHFIEPIYLASVVLGSLFHPSHLVRAIGGRIGPTAQGLPPPYRLHTPLLAATSSPEVRQPGKAPNYSINWTCTQPAAEVINAMTGKNEAGQASRLCKRFLFLRFRRLVGRLRSITEALSPAEADGEYADVKRLNQPYACALGCLVEAFQRAELGDWVKKPLEQDMFRVDPSEPLPPPPQPTAPSA